MEHPLEGGEVGRGHSARPLGGSMRLRVLENQGSELRERE